MAVRRLTVTPTIAGLYSANDVLGGLLTFADAAQVAGGGGKILAVEIVSKIAWVNTDLLIYDSAPTVPADNAASDLAAADIGKVVGPAVFSASTAFGVPNVAVREYSRLGYQCRGGKALYGQLVTRGAPTYTAGDLSVSIIVETEEG